MEASLYSSPNNKILNDYDYNSNRPLTIRSQIVKADFDSSSLSDINIEQCTNDVQCRADDWFKNLNEKNNLIVRDLGMKNPHAFNKQKHEIIGEFTKRKRNQDHVLGIKECNKSFDINSTLRTNNDSNRYVDSQRNINFNKYEKNIRNRKEITLKESDIRFVKNEKNIHSRTHCMYNKDLFNHQIVNPNCHGSIYNHMNQNRAKYQFRSRHKPSNTLVTRLYQDNNEDKAGIDSKDIEMHDNERSNIIQVIERRDRLANNKISPPTPTLHSIQKAEVRSIQPFGIFVQMEGYEDHGVVHISEVSNNKVSTPEDSKEAKMKALCAVAKEGENVWVKVISVKTDSDLKTRIGCSMKYVNQEDGRNLDPNNNHLEQQPSQPATFQAECLELKSGPATLLEEDEADETLQSQRKGKERMMPRELQSEHMQPCGLPRQLLATGSVGRGRAMVQPAWMKHGLGIGGPVAAASPVVEDEKQSSDVTERVTLTMEEGSAVIARLKEEKRRRKEERKRRRARPYGRPRRGERKERHKKRRHGEERHNHRKRHRF